MKTLIILFLLIPSLSYSAEYIRPGDLYKKGRSINTSVPKYRYDGHRDKDIAKQAQQSYKNTLNSFSRRVPRSEQSPYYYIPPKDNIKRDITPFKPSQEAIEQSKISGPRSFK